MLLTRFARISALLLVLCAAAGVIPVVQAIPENLLYDFSLSKVLRTGDDVSSNEIQLRTPIVFYGVTYTSIFINSNGILSFHTDLPIFFNIEFPLDYPIIAPLYSNIDTTGAGEISYFETADTEYLHRATRTIRDAFSSAASYTPNSVFIVTWHGVGYHTNGTDKLNTFQVAICSDGTDSYVEFLYPENGIQWIQGIGDQSGLPDARAQAGFISADGRFFTLPGSGTDQIRYLDRRSNMNLPGQWLFRIGDLDADANVEQPDRHNSQSVDKIIPTSCSSALTQCHIHAKCIDYELGYCCNCKKGYYGNGKICIKRDVPLRVNGKVKATINGEYVENLDLQSYIVMSDARAYTAMSKIPHTIGFDIQSLQVLGATIGWVFAKPVNSALNGFQLTGGVFNQSVTILFPNTNQKCTIRQKYLGLDVFDQLKLETEIVGEIPNLPIDSQIIISEYQEEYTQTSPGVIQSSSRHMFKYTHLDEEIEVPYQIEQSIVFDYCKFAADNTGTTWRLKVGKNFINYESREQIIRYGMSNKITSLGEEIDPCIEGKQNCGPNSSCVVDDDAYRCVCNPGYQHIYINNEETCSDVNECTQGIHDCDYNAQCHNEIGTYRCICNPGFEGNGHVCENAKDCTNVQCNENAECTQRGNIAQCTCMQGFAGNGLICNPITSQSCHLANNCSPYGYCSISRESDLYACYCLPGYEGDGYTCTPVPTTVHHQIVETTTEMAATTTTMRGDHVVERCLLGVCWCPEGYVKDMQTKYCVRNTTVETESERHAQADTCDQINDCHVDAECLFFNNGHFKCSCRPGFEGDGYNCREIEISCSQSDICDIHATCNYDDNLAMSICICNPGYQGNGVVCHPIPICSSNDDCLENEECKFSPLIVGYDCVCVEGLIRDSQHQCVKVEGTCGGGQCVENAECLYDDEYQTYYCTCKKDYEGDGITSCKPRPVGCNVVNNCGLHASCEYNQLEGSYGCTCNDGFYGDGFICYSEKNCLIDPTLCDTNAVCITDANQRYKCECNPGFNGNGTLCYMTPKHDGNFLLVNQGVATLKLPLDAMKKVEGKPIQMKYFQLAVGLDVDCFGGRVYWSDINLKAIRSVSYNGSEKADFITTDIGSPEGLAVDWVSRNIYWTDSTRDTIEVANIESKLRTVLFNTNLVNPRGIAVHPQRGKIFWSDWDRANPKIEWANADGTGREIFIAGNQNVQLPNSLTVDFYAEQLCYADAGTKKIVCVNIDTKQPQVMAVNCTYPFGIAVTIEHIYWSDWISKKIEVVDKYSLKRLPPLEVPLGGTGNKLYGLAAAPDRCPDLTNVCIYHKDQCPINYICLPDGRGSRRCVCGEKLNSDEKFCNDI